MQQSDLKALSEAVLQRNKARNRSATRQEKPCNKPPEKQPHLLHAPTTFEEAHELLNSLGDWSQVMECAPNLCPDLLEVARQTNRKVDRNPTDVRQYYQAWHELFQSIQ